MPTELLINPTFESGTTFPDNWTTYISGTTPTFLYPVTPGNNNIGTAIGIQYSPPPAPAPADHSFSAILQSVNIDSTHSTYSTKNYHISGYIKTDTLSPVGNIAWDTGARIMVDWRDDLNNVISTSEIMTPVYGNPVGWTKYEYDITSALNATKANISLLLVDTTGSAYFDDISFTELSTIVITYPSVITTLVLNNLYDITWNYSGNENTNVKLDLYKNDIFQLEISASTPIGNYGLGTFSWLVPTSLIEGTDYKIRITNTNDPNPNPYDSNQFTISATECLTPVSNFTFQVQSDGRTVYFDSSSSSNNPTSWNWYFDDGFTSNEPNPYHTYNYNGQYLVYLQTSNSCGYGTTVQYGVFIGQQQPAEPTSISQQMSQQTKDILLIGGIVGGIVLLHYVTKPDVKK